MSLAAGSNAIDEPMEGPSARTEAVMQELRDDDSVKRLWFHSVGGHLHLTGSTLS